MPPVRRPTRRELVRAGTVAVLFAVGVYGARGLTDQWAALSVHRPSTASLIAVLVLEAVAATLLVAALRGRREAPGVGRRSALLAAGYALVVLGPPIMLLLLAARDNEVGDVRVFPRAEEPRKRKLIPAEENSNLWALVLTILLAVLAVVALAVIAFLVVRRRRRARRTAPGPEADFSVPPSSDRFEEAAAAGSRALRSTDEARAAVIACYLAMVGVLAEAGADPRDSDTPAEVLARAAGSGVAGLDAATTLTDLFREARFSAHPVTELHRARALAALESLRAGSTV
ncbi:hypothetical protein GCM10022254_17260 [Actinomadura meridiana]|uniref:Protein-glutamine gamma-glutamyltransferase-like C-terminal domain-containing protein n=1 Tax=Actinomadura meridiana TaxID=559626 RepID=A0ABP8BWN1_9ACTN